MLRRPRAAVTQPWQPIVSARTKGPRGSFRKMTKTLRRLTSPPDEGGHTERGSPHRESRRNEAETRTPSVDEPKTNNLRGDHARRLPKH